MGSRPQRLPAPDSYGPVGVIYKELLHGREIMSWCNEPAGGEEKHEELDLRQRDSDTFPGIG